MSTTVVTAKFTADTSDLQGKLSGVQGQLDKTANKMKASGESAAAMGRQMTMAAAPIIAFGALATKAFIDFDDKMTQSLAIMTGVTSAMRAEMETTARTVSQTFGIAADKAAESYFFLASAGLDAQQSMAALPQVAAFATAGMFDMATATDLATDAQSALGLTVDDAAANLDNLTRVTDVLVKANTLANATVEQFSIALTNKAGAALKAVNKDMEEGVAVLAAFADQGIKAQLAGNQLAIIMRDLQTKAIDNKADFEKFGLSVFDADGKMRKMADIVENLEQITAGMSDEQKRATLGMMGFSDRSLSAMTALFGTSDAIRQYEEDLRNAGGTTQDVAGSQMESMAKQIEVLKARFMDLALGVGSVLVTQFLSPLVGVLDSLLGAFSAIPEPIRNMAISLGLVVALAGPMLWMAGSVMKGLAAMGAAFAAANARIIAFGVSALARFKAVGAGAGTMGLHVAAALTSKRVALEVASLAAKKFQAAVTTAFRAVGAAAKGLLASLGPIGLALIGLSIGFEVLMNRSQASEARIDSFRESIDETTRSLNELGLATIAQTIRDTFAPEVIAELDALGISMQDMIEAVAEGGDVFENLRQRLIDMGKTGNTIDENAIRRALESINDDVNTAKVQFEQAERAKADAAGVEGKRAMDAVQKQIDQSRRQAIERADALKNMSAAERAAMDERKRAADIAIDAQNKLNAAHAAGMQAVGRMEIAFATLNHVMNNTAARRAVIEGNIEMDKALGKSGKSLDDNTKAGRENNKILEDQVKKIAALAQATDDPEKQYKRLAKGLDEVTESMKAKGLDPNKSAIVKALQRQVKESEETVNTFNKRREEARKAGESVGRNFIIGIIEELRTGKPKVDDAAGDSVSGMEGAANDVIEAKSPSKAGMRIAKNFVDGIALGLKADKLLEKSSDLAKAVIAGFQDEIRRVEDLMESASQAFIGMADLIAKPFGTASQIMQNFGKTAGISSIVSGVKEITSLITQAYAPLLDRSLVGAGAARRNRRQMNDQLGQLQAFGQHAVNLRNEYNRNLEEISRLEKEYGERVERINTHFDGLDEAAQASIERIESHWDGIIPGLQAALSRANDAYSRENQILQSLISQRDNFLKGIASGFRSFVNSLSFDSMGKKMIRETKTLANGVTVTMEREIAGGASAANIAASLQDRLASVRSFAENIRTLMARGLDPTLIQEFVAAGVSGAGDAAAALVSASDSELASINEAQAGLASEIASFQQYASAQWHDAGIAQQEAITAPLRAAAEAAQAALDMANSSRDAELKAARAHLKQLRDDRKAALDLAKTEHDAEIKRLEGDNIRLEGEMDALAAKIDKMLTDLAENLPPKAFAAGQKSMRQLRAGFEERFPKVSAKLNQMMDALSASMNRVSTVTIRTVHEAVKLDGTMAKGGSVSANSVYLVGEKGPEIFVPGGAGSIIPNHEIGSVPSMGSPMTSSGGGTTINITVNAPPLTDPAEVGRQAVEAIRKYERRSGPVFVSA